MTDAVVTSALALIERCAVPARVGCGRKAHALLPPEGKGQTYCGHTGRQIEAGGKLDGCLTCAALIYVSDRMDWDVTLSGPLLRQLRNKVGNVGGEVGQ